MSKILYVTTISMTLDYFLKGTMTELVKAGHEVVAVSSPGEWMAAVKALEGVKVVEVPMERRIAPFKDLRSLLRLYKVLREERPDIVHSFTPKAGLLAMMASKFAGIKVRIHTFTGLVFPTSTGLKRRLLMTTDRLTCACATNIIAEGQGVRNDLLSAGITHKDVRVLGHGNIRGIDLERYDRTPEIMQLAEKLRVPDAFTFLFVGRLVRDKGIAELCEAFHHISIGGQDLPRRSIDPDTAQSGSGIGGQDLPRRSIDPDMAQSGSGIGGQGLPRRPFTRLGREAQGDWGASCRRTRMVLVGPFEDDVDPVGEEVKEYILRTPEIITTGEIKGPDLLAWYAASDCFVLPSYREGFPNTVIEAGAMGLPSIVTDINGSREIISDGINGLVVPPKNVEALSEAMKKMLIDSDFRERAASVSRDMIASRFEQGYVRKCLLDFYHSVLLVNNL